MKWFVTDMDGTFLNDEKNIAPNAREVIEELRKKGGKFYIATGRIDLSIRNYYNELGVNDLVIANNGSLIRNPFTKEIIYQKPFDRDTIRTIYNLYKENGDDSIEFHIYTLNGIYCDRLSYSMRRIQKAEKNTPEELKTPMEIHENIIEVIEKRNEDCQKIMILHDDITRLTDFFDKVKDVVDVYGTFSAKNFFDIMPKDCNKGIAIEKMAEHYGYDIKDCVVFGDNFNDKEMLKVAGLSVCPSNASKEIQDMCDLVIGNNNDFSVLNYIKDYVDTLK